MMTEDEIREFIENAISISGDTVSTTALIQSRWIGDRAGAMDEARDEVYDGIREQSELDSL